ncbi:MATE family efflux transporter, partial [Fusobacterium varium]
MGLNQGRQPLLSYNWGAKNYERVKKIFYSSITLTAAISLFLLFVVIVNARTVVNFFVKNDLELTEYTIRGTYIHLYTPWLNDKYCNLSFMYKLFSSCWERYDNY